ncbi:MAG: hypothetical protein KKF50_01290 [Nanoarchaeota archaeon]|nr:hypothetical protein [Nanoarchaeota archaeon]
MKKIGYECKIKNLGIGWKSKIIMKRATAYISINKLVVEGCCMEKGQILYSYLVEDGEGRKMIITYPDGDKIGK